MEITFAKIEKSYPNSKVLGIEEFYNEGWVGCKEMINSYVSPQEANKRIVEKIVGGATVFNFKIEDEFGVIRYPDFLAKEIIK